MNLFKWLISKAGKMPISFAQAAGITAVVGAAGVAAISYLNSPTDNNTSFIPPSAYEQNVQYVAQGGSGSYGSSYAPNGEVASSFNAAPSQSIRLANQRYEREQRAKALRDAGANPAYDSPAEDGEEGTGMQLPKAYQVGAGDMGLGMGETFDKQMNSTLATLTKKKKNIPGVSEAITNAQVGGAAGQPGAGEGASEQKPQFTKASANWSQGGNVHAGSGNGVNNTFAIQNSGKNGGGKGAGGTSLAGANRTMANAQASLKNMQEGARLPSRASFGRMDGLEGDGNYGGGSARYGRDGRDDLDFIHRQTKKIVRNPRNAPNAGGLPLMASTKLTGGVRVEDGTVMTPRAGTSADLGALDRQVNALGSKLNSVQNEGEKRTKKRHELRKWMWWALPLALVLIPMIGTWADLARSSGPFGIVFWGFAIAAAALALFPIYKLIEAGISYTSMSGGDFSSKFAIALGGFLGGGVALALTVPAIGAWMGGLATWVLGAAAGIGFAGAYIFKFLSEKGDGYTDEQLDDNLTHGSLEDRAENLRK